MKRLYSCGIFLLLFFAAQTSTKAQETVVPAGTLLHCTLSEPNFSTATATVGDPVLCPLAGLQQFGRVVFPRGSYLEGHLEAAKDPGHFFGKGYLKLEFDRIGLPNTDIPVPSKVIQARGYRVNKEGAIVGKGHATRDAVEWMFPPLWPIKVLTLPMRGPRPAIKGEEQLTLRLMDDIAIPRNFAVADPAPGWRYFGPATRPYASPESFTSPQPAAAATAVYSVSYRPSSYAAAPTSASQRVTLIALKSNAVLGVTSYRIDNGQVNYVASNGVSGSVDVHDVDWRTTSELNATPKTSVPSVPLEASLQR